MQEAFRKRMQAKGLQFTLPEGPLTVVMEDEIMHTVSHPVCDDPTCCCYKYERQAMIQETTPAKRRRSKKLLECSYEDPEQQRANAPLNGDRAFKLLR